MTLQNRTREQIRDELCDNKQPTGLDTLPKDLLISILSCLPVKEAGKTSVLSRKWRYLWQFTYGNLEFDDKNNITDPKKFVKWVKYVLRTHRELYDKNNTADPRKFVNWVNCVLKSHRGSETDQLTIRFRHFRQGWSRVVDSWINHAIQKKVKGFELDMSDQYKYIYNFPDLNTLSSRIRPAFLSLKSLRLVNVNVKEEVVHYFLASCPYLEELCVNGSDQVKNLKVVDPLPNFKVLEISNCHGIQSLEISVENLVSFTYVGTEIHFHLDNVPSLEISAKNLVSFTYVGEVIPLHMDNVPNLKELTLGGKYCKSFIFRSDRNFSYPVQLEKLVLKLGPNTINNGRRPLIEPPNFPDFLSLKELELEIVTDVKHNLLLVLPLIKATPLLQRFTIKIHLQPTSRILRYDKVSASEAIEFVHDHLKEVEISIGYICNAAEELISKIAPSVETLILDCQDEENNAEFAQMHKLNHHLFISSIKLDILPPYIKTFMKN